MTELSTLTDTELEERIASAFGHHPVPGRLWPDESATSLDALKAGPEKMLREAGWEVALGELSDGWTVSWMKHGSGFITVSAHTEPRSEQGRKRTVWLLRQ